jgi:hypothetical protein
VTATTDHPSPAASGPGPTALGAPLLLVDSITEAVSNGTGCVVVSGSHGGASAAHYALLARPLLAVFNDAGIGKDDAGIAALALLQAQGLAACTVAHDSARIGDARSTLDDGVVSRANAGAVALGARPGQRLRDWLFSAPSAESSPGRR